MLLQDGSSKNDRDLRILREGSQLPLEEVATRVAKVLAIFDIPHLIVGGYAVQEHGYARMTTDVDVVVPNVDEARDKLSMNGFKENSGSSMTVTDRKTGIEVDLLPGGGSVGPGPVKLPVPTQVSSVPIIIRIEDLISIKLSSYIGSGVKRTKDLADVVELIGRAGLDRILSVNEAVEDLYLKTWDEISLSTH